IRRDVPAGGSRRAPARRLPARGVRPGRAGRLLVHYPGRSERGECPAFGTRRRPGDDPPEPPTPASGSRPPLATPCSSPRLSAPLGWGIDGGSVSLYAVAGPCFRESCRGTGIQPRNRSGKTRSTEVKTVSERAGFGDLANRGGKAARRLLN